MEQQDSSEDQVEQAYNESAWGLDVGGGVSFGGFRSS